MVGRERSIFFNDTATTEIYTLSLHDALPICQPHDADGPAGAEVVGAAARRAARARADAAGDPVERRGVRHVHGDRKCTRLNSSHANISYAVSCLKKIPPTPSTFSSLHSPLTL